MDNRVLLVTGASRGIGAAVARIGAARGYRVCVNYRASAQEAEAVVDEIRQAGGTAFAVAGDTGSERDVVDLFAAVDREYGRIDALVNNAGIYGDLKPVDALSGDEIRRVLDVNVLGYVLCAREAVRRMARKHGGAGGQIVNVSSIAGQNGASPGRSLYGLSKGAVDTFTKGLAKEVAGDGIRVNAVAPGLTDTAFNPPGRVAGLAQSVPIQRIAEPEEIAQGILWLMSDEASYCVGSSLVISGGRA
jgi:NAD(P)-dependent dehydrogenase (short-subunit alcohol dehydrogenase family)